jgi:NADH-quinone oxidoreductase subunit N
MIYGGTAHGVMQTATGILPAAAGTTDLSLIASLPASVLLSPYALIGAGLIIVGLGFKAAIVPFHNWAPDVYEGSPTTVTAFMSAGAKAAAFATFIRVVVALLGSFAFFHGVLWILALLTMVVGNVLAVAQSNVKRMLAFSSVAHAGYILVGLVANNAEGRAGVLYYTLVYTFMNLGAFGVLIWLSRRGEELNTLDDLQGLSQRQPAAAALMALFMLSLGGIPPMAGFFGKAFLFLAAIHAQQYGLAVAGLLASVIGVFYYLRVVVAMYFQPVKREYAIRNWGFAPGADIALIISALFSIGLGVFSQPVYHLASLGAESLNMSSTSLDPAPVETASVPQPAVLSGAGAPAH